MGKTKEERARNKAVRQQRNSERKQKFEAMIAAAHNVPDISDEDFAKDYREHFDKVWPAVKAALDFAISLKVTGSKADAAMIEIIGLGDQMASGTATQANKDRFEQQLAGTWKVARMAIGAATVLTNDKTDEALEKVLAIGDWITGVNEN